MRQGYKSGGKKSLEGVANKNAWVVRGQGRVSITRVRGKRRDRRDANTPVLRVMESKLPTAS